jgi:hypothetical protein
VGNTGIRRPRGQGLADASMRYMRLFTFLFSFLPYVNYVFLDAKSKIIFFCIALLGHPRRKDTCGRIRPFRSTQTDCYFECLFCVDSLKMALCCACQLERQNSCGR